MKKYIIFSALAMGMTFLCQKSFAYGCFAIRLFSGVENSVGQNNLLQKSEWNTSTNYRFFKTYKLFRGSHEEPERVEKGTVLINSSYSMDFNISYAFSERLHRLVFLPFAYNESSSLYEHGRTERHTSYSGGFADMRIGAVYWLRTGEKAQKENYDFGLGLNLPAEDYAFTSTFYNVQPNGKSEVRPVDQSIQLGDVGVRLIVYAQGIRSKGESTFLSYNGF
jgi:hypothetical protein